MIAMIGSLRVESAGVADGLPAPDEDGSFELLVAGAATFAAPFREDDGRQLEDVDARWQSLAECVARIAGATDEVQLPPIAEAEIKGGGECDDDGLREAKALKGGAVAASGPTGSDAAVGLGEGTGWNNRGATVVIALPELPLPLEQPPLLGAHQAQIPMAALPQPADPEDVRAVDARVGMDTPDHRKQMPIGEGGKAAHRLNEPAVAWPASSLHDAPAAGPDEIVVLDAQGAARVLPPLAEKAQPLPDTPFRSLEKVVNGVAEPQASGVFEGPVKGQGADLQRQRLAPTTLLQPAMATETQAVPKADTALTTVAIPPEADHHGEAVDTAVLAKLPDTPAQLQPLDPSGLDLRQTEAAGRDFASSDARSVEPRLSEPRSAVLQAVPALLVRTAQSAPDGPVTVTLAPEELGSVRFEMQGRGESLHISLVVERPETLDLLRRHMDQLVSEFRQAGFTATSFSFAGAWGGERGRGGDEGGRHDPYPRGDGPEHGVAASAGRRSAGGGLDLRL